VADHVLPFAFIFKQQEVRPLGWEGITREESDRVSGAWVGRALPGNVYAGAPDLDAAIEKLKRSLEARFEMSGDPAAWWTEAARRTLVGEDRRLYTEIVGGDARLPDDTDNGIAAWIRNEPAEPAGRR
jgi:hypothetical protein